MTSVEPTVSTLDPEAGDLLVALMGRNAADAAFSTEVFIRRSEELSAEIKLIRNRVLGILETVPENASYKQYESALRRIEDALYPHQGSIEEQVERDKENHL